MWTFLRMSLIGIGISVLISVIGDTIANHNQFLPDLSSTVVINAISLIVALLLITFYSRRRTSAL